MSRFIILFLTAFICWTVFSVRCDAVELSPELSDYAELRVEIHDRLSGVSITLIYGRLSRPGTDDASIIVEQEGVANEKFRLSIEQAQELHRILHDIFSKFSIVESRELLESVELVAMKTLSISVSNFSSSARISYSISDRVTSKSAVKFLEKVLGFCPDRIRERYEWLRLYTQENDTFPRK